MSTQNERQVVLQKIYVKDASLEIPQAPQVFTRQWQPKVDVQISTNSSAIDGAADTYQVMLSVTVTVNLEADVAVLVEVQQAGIFMVRGFPEDAERNAVLGAYCPSILFPYARESVSDLAQRGGFPQLLLQPVNFDGLYQEHLARQRQAAGEARESAPPPASAEPPTQTH
jgi:preprotein translocase subunit SecB